MSTSSNTTKSSLGFFKIRVGASPDDAEFTALMQSSEQILSPDALRNKLKKIKATIIDLKKDEAANEGQIRSLSTEYRQTCTEINAMDSKYRRAVKSRTTCTNYKNKCQLDFANQDAYFHWKTVCTHIDQRFTEHDLLVEKAKKTALLKKEEDAKKKKEQQQLHQHNQDTGATSSSSSSSSSNFSMPAFHSMQRTRVMSKKKTKVVLKKVGRGVGITEGGVTEQRFNNLMKTSGKFKGKSFTAADRMHDCFCRHDSGRDGFQLRCNACKSYVKCTSGALSEHIWGGGKNKDWIVTHHTRNIQQWQPEILKQQTLAGDIEAFQVEHNLTGTTHLAAVKTFRHKTVMLAADMNVALNKIHTKGKPYIESWANETMGSRMDLCNAWPLLEQMEVKKNKLLLSLCYPQFSLTSDGTPSFAEFEAFRIRCIRRDTWEIVNPLVGCYELLKSPIATELAATCEHVIVDVCGLEIKNWRSSSMDRAATNLKAIRLLQKKHEMEIFMAKCIPHTLCHCGDHFEGEKLKLFRSGCATMFMHATGHANIHFKGVFNCRPLTGSSVRWWHSWEQIAQIYELGIEKFMTDVVAYCLENGYSEASVKKLTALMSDPVVMARVLIEAAAQTDAGLIFCIVTYLLEGDNPLVFVAHEVLAKVDNALEEGIELKRVEEIADRCVELVSHALDEVNDAIVAAKASVNTAKVDILQAKAIVQEKEALVRPDEEVDGVDGGRKSKRTKKYTHKNEAGRAKILEQEQEKALKRKNLQVAEEDLQKKEDILVKANKKLVNCEIKHAARVEEVGPMTRDTFIAYAKTCVQKGYDYYENKFNLPAQRVTLNSGGAGVKFESGEMRGFKQALFGARIFDPEILISESIDKLERRIDALKHFKYPEFTDDFLANMKKEIALAKQHAAAEFDWEKTKGADEYNKKKTRKEETKKRNDARRKADQATEGQEKKRRSAPAATKTPTREDIVFESWRDDYGEKSRRIWEWWVSRCTDDESDFVYFKLAVRLVAITQVSSASVERVFSVVVQIMHACGVNVLHDNFMTRLFRMINTD